MHQLEGRREHLRLAVANVYQYNRLFDCFSQGDGLTAHKLIDACAKRLPAEMPGLSNMRRKEMKEAIAKLGKELRDTQADSPLGWTQTKCGRHS